MNKLCVCLEWGYAEWNWNIQLSFSFSLCVCVYTGQGSIYMMELNLMHELNRHLRFTLLPVWRGTSSRLISCIFPGWRPKHLTTQCSDTVANLNLNYLRSTVKVFAFFPSVVVENGTRQFSGHVEFISGWANVIILIRNGVSWPGLWRTSHL